MGTRGLYGFRKNGEDKLTYNHWDSYPDWLGKNVVEFCKETSIEEMNKIFDSIVLVDECDKPTNVQIDECIEYYNDRVSTQNVEDWYCLLREAQGNLNVYKHGLKYMMEYSGFIKNSLMCEYAYIINLDDDVLEFYVGFQKNPDPHNRYGTKSDGRYYPCKMVAFYPLDSMDKHAIEYYINDMNKQSEVD